MSNETDQAPERIWLTLLDAEIQAERVSRTDIEYVRADLLTTARREAREEAFREASNLVHAMSRIEARGKSFDFLNGAAWMQNKAALLLAQRGVEAAAVTQKGDTDGR